MNRRALRIRRRVKAMLVAGGLALAAVITVAGLLVASLSQAAPAWWRTYRLTDDLREHATAVENAAVTHLYANRPADPGWTADPDAGPWRSESWAIALKDEDISAWLAARLRPWYEGQPGVPEWPPELGTPQIHFDDGRIRVGVRITREDGSRVLSASVTPQIRDDGSIWLSTDAVQVGRLPLPAGLMLAHAEDRLADDLPPSIAGSAEAAGLFGVLRGQVPLAETPVFNLDDGRAVRLQRFAIRDGRLVMECRTVSRRTATRD